MGFRKAARVFVQVIFFGVFIFLNTSRLIQVDAVEWDENFTNSLENNWTIYQNNGLVNLSDGWLLLTSDTFSYPYLRTKTNPFAGLTEFSLEIKFRYSATGPWGTGVLIGNEAPPNNSTSDYLIQHDAKIAQFKIWQDWNGFRIKYHHSENEAFSKAIQLDSRSPDTQEHILKINRGTDKYEVYLDGLKIFTSDETERVPSVITIGNSLFLAGSLNAWTDINVDYISFVDSQQDTAPIILLPGLGASWNTEAILLGEKKPQNEWAMTPFVNVYDNLVNTLVNGGYTKDEDLFVFNYDWRQPIEETAQELNNFVDNNIGEDDSVNLVGHSLGGLVSRAYWQQYGEEKVDKVVTLGTPHQGVVQAYEALAGGKISDTLNWSSAALNILLRLRNPFYKTSAEILQEEAPVLHDLSPTFEFIKKGRRIVPLNKLSFQNNWLSGANSSLSDLSKISFVSGNTGVNVTEWLKIKSPSPIDKLLGLWPDGFPYKSFKGKGDQTVLLKSSYLSAKDPDIFNVSHRHLPSSEDSIEKVLAILGINTPVLTETEIYPRNNTLVFLIASPATLEVIDPSQQSFFSDSQGFVIIPNPQGGSYSVKLHGTGNGEYHLVAGQLFGSDNWSVYQGEIETGTDLIYKFDIDPDQPKENPLSQDEKERLYVVLEEINHLQSKYPSSFLSGAETSVQQAIAKVKSSDWEKAAGEVKGAINRLFDFRKENFEVQPLNRSEKIISLLTDVLSSLLEKSGGATYREAKSSFQKAQKQRSLAWRIIRLKKRRKQLNNILLISFKSGDVFINKTKQFLKDKDYSAVSAYSYTTLFFFKEI